MQRKKTRSERAKEEESRREEKKKKERCKKERFICLQTCTTQKMNVN